MPKDTQVATKSTISPPQGARAPRINARVRQAIDHIAREGTTTREAAKRAGLNESSLYRALGRPNVAAHLEQAKALYCMEIDKLRGTAKAIAIQTGIDLMQHSNSDNVRARLVEFFAGEAKQPLVNVSVSTAERGVYAYTKPRDITPAPDSASGGAISQAVEIEGKVVEPDQHG